MSRNYLDHQWMRAGAASNFDIHYWCKKCGLLRHDTGWGPVKESYHQPGVEGSFQFPSACKKLSWWNKLIQFFKGQTHAN